MTGSHSSRPRAHECDDPAYPVAAMPDECTCGSSWTGDRWMLPLFHNRPHCNHRLEDEAAMARRRLGFTSQDAER